MSTHPHQYLRTIHSNMMSRCYNRRHESFPFYGAKGVVVHPAWHDVSTFVKEVLELIGERPTGVRPNGLSIWEFDRINSYGNYAPGNVRWLEHWKNQRNKRQRTATPKPRRKKSVSLGEYDPYMNPELPPYMFTNSSGTYLNSSYFVI